jgi:hypothetical protein
MAKKITKTIKTHGDQIMLLNDQLTIDERMGEIKKFLDRNEHEYIIYQNLWDKAQAVSLKGEVYKHECLHQKTKEILNKYSLDALQSLRKTRTSQSQV